MKKPEPHKTRRWSLATILLGLVVGCGAQSPRGPVEVAGPTSGPAGASASGQGEPRTEAAALAPVIERIQGECIDEYMPRKLTIDHGKFSISKPEKLDEVEIAGSYTVVSSDDWSVTVDCQASGITRRIKAWILDDGHLYVGYLRGRRCKPVGRPLAHGDGSAFRQELLAQLQGSWSNSTVRGRSFSVEGNQARAVVDGSKYSGTLSVRAASAGLLIADLETDTGESWIAAFVFQPDGSVEVELKKGESPGWSDLGGGIFEKEL
jgi:hypothetical protein